MATFGCADFAIVLAVTVGRRVFVVLEVSRRVLTARLLVGGDHLDWVIRGWDDALGEHSLVANLRVRGGQKY